MSMGDDGFTEGAQKALGIGQEEAKKLGHKYVGTEHVLLGLARAEEGVTAKVFRENDITPERVQDLVYRLVGQGDGVFTQAFDYTPRTKRVLQMSVALARSLGHSYVGSEHILLAILRESDGIAARLLMERITGNETGPCRELLVPANPVYRQSCGCAL